jgi:hypothetical protein
MELQLEGEANFLLVLGHMEAHPKTTLYGVVFQKLNGPLLTMAENGLEKTRHGRRYAAGGGQAAPPTSPAHDSWRRC